MRRMAAALLCMMIGSGAMAPAAGAQADTRKELSAAIAGATKLLEAKDYAGFINTFMRPEELKGLLEKFGTIEKLAAAYGESRKPAAMLKALEAAAAIEPSITGDGTRASYVFAAPIDGERRLRLVKVGDRWYIED